MLRWFLAVLFVLLLGLFFLVRSPWGQDIIVRKATQYVSGKTGTKVEIESLFFTLKGNLLLKGLYLEDGVGDTLLYSRYLETGLAVWPLISQGDIQVQKLDWSGIRVNIQRDSLSGDFNFQFLIDAFFSGKQAVSDTSKTTASKPFLIQLGPVRIQDFKASYVDELEGVALKASWVKLGLISRKIDLSQLAFDLEQLTLYQADIDFLQFKESPKTDTVLAGDSPFLLALEKIHLSESQLKYQSIPDGITLGASWNDLSASLPAFDLLDKKILVKHFAWNDPLVSINLQPIESPVESSGTSSIEWPGWNIEVGGLSLKHASIGFQVGQATPKPGLFQPDAMFLEGLDLSAHAIFLKNQKAGLHLDNLSFSEASGLSLAKAAFDLAIDDQKLQIKEIVIESPHSQIKGNMSISYASLKGFIEDPFSLSYALDFPTLKTDFQEVIYFQPDLKSDPYFLKLKKNPLTANLTLSGNRQRVEIPKFQASLGKETRISLNQTHIFNFLEPEKIRFNILKADFSTEGQVLKTFLPELNWPEMVALNFQASGGLEKAIGNLVLNSSEGEAGFDFDWDQEAFSSISIQGKALEVGKWLGLEALQPLSFQGNIQGKGNNLNDVQINGTLDFGQLVYGEADLSGLHLDLDAKDTLAQLLLKLENQTVNLDANLRAKLDTATIDLGFKAVVNDWKTQAFGLTQKDISAQLTLDAYAKGTIADLEAEIKLSDGLMFFEKKAYPLGPVNISSRLADQGSFLEVDSDFLNGKLQTNKSFTSLGTSLRNYLESYFAVDKEYSSDGLWAKADFSFRTIPFLDQLLFAPLDRMDTVRWILDFQSDQRKLDTKLQVPKLSASGAEVSRLNLEFFGEKNGLRTNLGFEELKAGPVDMGETRIEGKFEEQLFTIDFGSKKEGEDFFFLRSYLQNNGDTLVYSVDPQRIIFNKIPWKVHPANQLRVFAKGMEFADFVLASEEQRLEFSNSLPNVSRKHIGVVFNKLSLENIFSFLNPDNSPVKGLADGGLAVVDPYLSPGLVSGLGIKNLEVLGIPLGKLSLFAEATTLKDYDFRLGLSEGYVEADLSGGLHADSLGTSLDLGLELRSLQMSFLEVVSDSMIKDTKGYLSGAFKLGGLVSDLTYQGALRFHDAGFNIAMLNSRFSIPEESLRINNEGLFFDDFVLKDEQGKDFLIKGGVLTPDLGEPIFDLRLATKDFLVLNSTRKDNDLFYGKALVDMDLRLSGSSLVPQVDVDLFVNKGTEVSLIVPEDQLDLIERTGVVIFVDRNDPYHDMYQPELDFGNSGLVGFDVRANLKMDPNTVFNLIVDERTKDNLRLQGEADLSFLMDPNGNMSLSGKYEVKSGHYELNLYNLVNRKFLLAEGSTVLWNGDILDATLNMKAIYEVRTSPAELMRAQLSGSSTELQGQFRQPFPFLVYLNIDGEIMKPEMSFALDMKEQDQGAFGGKVFTTLQQVNQREDELIKQVFSLLVLNQFFPSSGNDGSSGGTVNLARSSVTQLLSSQLNVWSDKLFGAGSGFSMDFNLDTYRDSQGGKPQDVTQLNVAAKQMLMDNRLVIAVGSQVNVEGSNRNVNQSEALFGDVSMEYLLDSKGQWRAKAYRRNSFESVIDGQLVVTGIALIFQKEFNEFKELWKRASALPSKEEDVVPKNDQPKEKNQ